MIGWSRLGYIVPEHDALDGDVSTATDHNPSATQSLTVRVELQRSDILCHRTTCRWIRFPCVCVVLLCLQGDLTGELTIDEDLHVLISFFCWQYLFLYVYEVSGAQETGGLFYPLALGHIFIGLYIEQICLAGLFFLGSAPVQGVFMVILIVCTAFFHTTLNSGYHPLVQYLPLSLAARMAEIQNEPPSPELGSPATMASSSRMGLNDDEKNQIGLSRASIFDLFFNKISTADLWRF